MKNKFTRLVFVIATLCSLFSLSLVTLAEGTETNPSTGVPVAIIPVIIAVVLIIVLLVIKKLKK